MLALTVTALCIIPYQSVAPAQFAPAGLVVVIVQRMNQPQRPGFFAYNNAVTDFCLKPYCAITADQWQYAALTHHIQADLAVGANNQTATAECVPIHGNEN